jgi:hypothetical protein
MAIAVAANAKRTHARNLFTNSSMSPQTHAAGGSSVYFPGEKNVGKDADVAS